MSMWNFMYFWSWLFSPAIGTILFCALALFFLSKKQYAKAWMVGLAGTGTAAVVALLKVWVNKPRPRIDASLWATSASFPSGHAASIACFALLMWWFFSPKKYRAPLLILALMAMALVGGSRLYFGVHDIVDISAGYAIGTLFALGAIGVDRAGKVR